VQSISVTDSVDRLSAAASAIAVQPAAASSLSISGFPTTDTAGTSNSFTVTAYDPYGNVATGYTGTIQFSSSDDQAGMPISYTFVAADNGTHTFSATLRTAGIQYLKASDIMASAITGSLSGIVVKSAGATA
jgi:hypothetical protein